MSRRSSGTSALWDAPHRPEITTRRRGGRPGRKRQASLADRRVEGSRAHAELDLDKEEGSERERQHQPESGVEGGVPGDRSSLPRPSPRGRVPTDRRRLAGTSRPAHAGARVPPADEYVPEHDAPWAASV